TKFNSFSQEFPQLPHSIVGIKLAIYESTNMCKERRCRKVNKSKLQTTIPYNLYVNPETLEMEKKEIFYKDWIMVGHESQVKNIGEFFTFDLVGEPLIITKKNENQLNAMYNICPHRGTILERSDHGNKKILQCMYHEWTLHLDGKLNRAP